MDYYNKNIEKRIITKQMLIDCLETVKMLERKHRAKADALLNCYDDCDVIGEKWLYEQRKISLYEEKKSELLSIIKPACIHRVYNGPERERIYNYEDTYELAKEGCCGKVVATGFDYKYSQGVAFVEVEIEGTHDFEEQLVYVIDANHWYYVPLPCYNTANSAGNVIDVVDMEQMWPEEIALTEVVSEKVINAVLRLIRSSDYTYLSDFKEEM